MNVFRQTTVANHFFSPGVQLMSFKAQIVPGIHTN